MTYHTWGDEWPHWNELYTAQSWMIKMWWRSSGTNMQTKEKYGTIRYEYEWSWLKTNEDVLRWVEIVRRACRKFQNVAAELVEGVHLDAKSSQLIAWYKGYFEGICWGARGSRWVGPGKKFTNPLE